MGYYHQFIPNFVDICEPLVWLLTNGVPFHWGPRKQVAFDKLKACLIEHPVPQHPNYDRPFILHTDASDYAVGAILSQLTLKESIILYCTSAK